MIFIEIIAVLLMIVPIALIFIGLKRYNESRENISLCIAGGGVFLFFILACVATGWILYSMMVCMVAVMTFAIQQVKKQATPWARPVVTLCAVVAVSVALISMVRHMTGCADNAAASEILDRAERNGIRIKKSEMKAIAVILRTPLEGRRALVINYSSDGKPIKAGSTALKRGVDGKVTIVDIVTPTAARGVDVDMGYRPSQFDELLAGRDDYDVVITFIPLPRDLEDMEYWKLNQKTRPKFVLATGFGYGLEQMLALNWCEGAVIRTPTYDAGLKEMLAQKKTINQSALSALTRHAFVYVDAENLAEMKGKYPEKFEDNHRLKKLVDAAAAAIEEKQSRER